MLQTNPQTDSAQVDLMALDALFKRIAERGRKIRSQNKTVDSDNLGGTTLSTAEQIDPEKESIHE